MRTIHVIAAIVGLGLACFAVVLGLLVFPDTVPPTRYPEFRSVPTAELIRARESLPPIVDRDTVQHWEWFTKYNADEALGGCSPLAVLTALHERAGPATIAITYGPTFDDDRRIPVGDWLARHADVTLNDVLLRLVEDEEMEFGLRDIAAVAICREGNDELVPALAAFVTDEDRSETLRTRVLHRLPRIGARLGKSVGPLIYFPFRGLDEIAAAALTLTGDPIAPSLLCEAVADVSWSPGDREHLLARAVLSIAESDREVSAQARLALDLIESKCNGGTHPLPPPPDQALEDLGRMFARWLGAHPEARISAFEREREAYRASDRYRREQATLNAEEPWTLPNDDFDLAAALLRVDPKKPGRRIRWLDALDRMAVFLRRKIDDRTDPDEILGVLHRRVLSDRHYSLGHFLDLPGPPSYLEHVLQIRSGNCVAWTSLYLALADRLDLPLVPVSTPNHVFVRWDDGENVIDVELTALGLLRPTGITGREAPEVISRRAIVAALYGNRSFTWRTYGLVKDEDRYEKALLYADRAVAWAPDRLDSHVARVQALTTLGDAAAAARAAEEAIAAFDADPASAAGLTTAGDVLFCAGDVLAALTWYDRALGVDPADGEILRRRLYCLERLDRNDELIREATAFLAERDHRGVRLLRLGAMARTGDERWRDELKALEGEGALRQMLRMNVAAVLLSRGAWEDAGEILDDLTDLDEAAAEAKQRNPLEDAKPLTNAAFQQHLDDTLLLDRWRRSIRLRARTLEAAGKTEEAEALREMIDR